MFSWLTKNSTPIVWIQIIVIWTMVALSMAIQMYLNSVLSDPDISFTKLFLNQIPIWYLCAILTFVILKVYERFPLHADSWRSNAIKYGVIAVLILVLFSHLRLAAMTFIARKSLNTFTTNAYINAYISQLAWDLAIYIIITVGVFASAVNRQRRAKEDYAKKIEAQKNELESQLRAAQLETLQLQLNPHFLFNALNTVNSLIRTDEHKKAIQVNAKLGELLRTTLYDDGKHFVTLQEELRLLDLYLGIEELRFSDRLRIHRQISDESLKQKVPRFILQPVIENAIKHGIAKNADSSCVSISATVENGSLLITVFNDGDPLPQDWNEETNNGIGLRNVRERLAKTYGTRASFVIQNDKKKSGVIVTLEIPIV